MLNAAPTTQTSKVTSTHLPEQLRSQSSPDGIRTRVTGLKGRRPRPLDDGALPRPLRSRLGQDASRSRMVRRTAIAHPDADVARASTSVHQSWESKRRGMVDCVSPTSHTDTSQNTKTARPGVERPVKGSKLPQCNKSPIPGWTHRVPTHGKVVEGEAPEGGIFATFVGWGWLPSHESPLRVGGGDSFLSRCSEAAAA